MLLKILRLTPPSHASMHGEPAKPQDQRQYQISIQNRRLL